MVIRREIEELEKGHDKMAMRVVEAERQLTWWTFGNYGVARIRKSLMKHLHLSRLDLVNNQVSNEPPLATASMCALSPTPPATHTHTHCVHNPPLATASTFVPRIPCLLLLRLLTPPLLAHTSFPRSLCFAPRIRFAHAPHTL